MLTVGREMKDPGNGVVLSQAAQADSPLSSLLSGEESQGGTIFERKNDCGGLFSFRLLNHSCEKFSGI